MRWLLPVIGMLCSAAAALAQPTLKVERGITATYTFEYAGPVLRAKVQRDTDAPLVVRLQRDRSTSKYQAKFIGNVSGQYDLRDWFEHADGSPMQSTEPLQVEVFSTLPKDPRSDLFDVDGFQPKLAGGYRWALALVILAWLAVPIVVIVRRFLSRPKQAHVVPAPPALSLAEQLKPFLEAAARGELSTGDKARLELLLVHYWRETAGLPELDMARSIQRLRLHPQAGPIIAAVEQWLHSGSSSEQRPSVQHILQLIGPIEHAVAVPVSTAAGSQAP